MISVLAKDLRELAASPIMLVGLAVISCLIIVLGGSLPLPEPELRIAVAPPPAACMQDKQPAGADIAQAAVDAEAGFACPFPDRATLVHAVGDLSGARYVALEGGAAEMNLAPREGRWVESEAWSTIDRLQLDVLFVWYPTLVKLDQLAEGGAGWLRTYGAESGGAWVAYTQSRSAAHAAQTRFGVRQAQATAAHIANVRKSGGDLASPSVGFADMFTEFGPVLVGLQHARRMEVAGVLAFRDSIEQALENRIEGYESDFAGAPLTEVKAYRLRSALSAAFSGLKANSWEKLQCAFRNQLLPPTGEEPPGQCASSEVASAPAISPEPAPAPAAPPAPFLSAEPDTTDPAAVFDVNAFTVDEVDYFTTALEPSGQEDVQLAPGEDPLLVLTPFLVTERDGPPRSTSAWIIPGLVLIIGSAAAFMLAGGAVAREREHGTEHLLFSGRSWWSVALGKAFAPACVAFAIVLLLMLTAQIVFGFEVKPAWHVALPFGMLALLAASFQGVAVGSLLRSQSTTLAASGAYLICLILFGDIFIPMAMADWPASWLAQALPTRQLSEGWADWMMWGAPLPLQTIGPLGLLLLASVTTALAASYARYRSA